MKKHFGFQFKLTVGFSLLSLLSTAAFGFISYRISSETAYSLMHKDLEDQLQGVRAMVDVSHETNTEKQNEMMDYWSDQVASKLNFDFNQTTEKEVTNQVTKEKKIANLPSLWFGSKRISDDSFVDEISAQSQEAVTIFAMTTDGLVRISTSVKDKDQKRANGTFIPTDSPVFKSIAEGKRYVGRAQVLGEWYVSAYEPISKDGKIIGAFFQGSPETSYKKIKAYLKEKRILQTGYFFILDSKGKFVLHPSKEGQDTLKMTDLDGKEIFKEILEKKSGRIEYRWLNAETKKAQTKEALFTYFPEMDWIVAASYNTDEAYSSVQHLEDMSWILGAVNLAAMILATLGFGIPLARRLKKIGEDLSGSAEKGRKDAAQLLSASQTVADGSTEQAASLEQTVSALDEIRAMVERNMGSTRQATEASQEMTTKAHAGREALNELNRSVKSIAESNQEVRQEIEKSFNEIENINKLIGEIKKRTEVINEIVFQTKLISLNAAVEAARAGQHGKGFAVVAEEVGRLAHMSGDASHEIEANLSRTMQSVAEIISQTKRNVGSLVQVTSNSITNGVKQTDQCQIMLEEVIQEVERTKDLINEISSASKEQTAGVSEITSAMHQLDKATQQNSMSAQKVNVLAGEVEANSQALEVSSQALREFLGVKEHRTAQVIPINNEQRKAA